MAKLTPKVLTSLEALDAAEGKRMNFRDFRKATTVKTRAIHPFVARLERDHLIAVDFGDAHGTSVELTFKGMQELRAHRAEAPAA